MTEKLVEERSDGLRPKGARIEGEQHRHAGAAAGAGRTDALDADSLLELQRTAGNAGVASLLEEEPSPVHDVIGSGGRPLEPDVRTEMEGRLGHDFGHVRVHDDAAAGASAQAVNAHAYTVGSDVVFQRDRYDPASAEGKVTLAHELTHVIQQSQGEVDGSPAAGGIRVSDPSDRFEQEAAAHAEHVMSGPAPGPAGPAVASDGSAGTAVQREELPEEEEILQGSFVQREADPEELEDEHSA
ncbi:DUF4157 domain-containing protein [uncultured Friedmanniella sp.]|uniref:eCIS core domain-containing protein n=1 Tax=uncultured Friedmanniella sp. TaxID=335381 RepID=UPI0035CB61B2